MTLQIFTLCLNGMPYLRYHLPIMEQLSCPWHWVIVHGTANNVGSTSWCSQIPPGLSVDGSTEYLKELSGHPNITVLEKEFWEGGKDQMVNAALEQFSEQGVVMQMDMDEVHSADSIHKAVSLFKTLPYLGCLQLKCTYYIGPDIILTGEGCYGSKPFEWVRFWRFYPGMRAMRHEPPDMPKTGLMMGREQTAELGITFQHFAYASRAQAFFKERYYNYPGAVDGWERLQKNSTWPALVRDFLPWVQDDVMAVRI